jgi:plasmid stabilization system protein ParE
MSEWKLLIEDPAKLDLQDVYDWYEKEKTGLGQEFLDEFELALRKIDQNPLHASYYDGQCRSTSLKRFPYSLIYLVNEIKAEVYIIAVSHQHRRPSWFSKRKK